MFTKISQFSALLPLDKFRVQDYDEAKMN